MSRWLHPNPAITPLGNVIGRAALTLTFFYSIFLPFFSLLEIDKLGEWIRIEFETCIEQFEKPGMYPSNFFSFFLSFFFFFRARKNICLVKDKLRWTWPIIKQLTERFASRFSVCRAHFLKKSDLNWSARIEYSWNYWSKLKNISGRNTSYEFLIFL